VIDIGDPGGYGIKFNDARVWDITYSVHRALDLYEQPKKMHAIRSKIMQLDNSWETSTQHYMDLYLSLK
jgi:starch synthase